MIIRYEKGADEWIVPGIFHLREFDCHCTRPDCVTTFVCQKLAQGLTLLRLKLGVPLTIERGYTCPAHNATIPGAAPGSRHLTGQAADTREPRGFTPQAVADVAETIPCFKNGGIGVGATKLHLDTRGRRARWRY